MCVKNYWREKDPLGGFGIPLTRHQNMPYQNTHHRKWRLTGLLNVKVQLLKLGCPQTPYRGDGVESSVRTNTEIRARNIVGDGGRNNTEWDADLFKSGSTFNQLQAACESLQRKGRPQLLLLPWLAQERETSAGPRCSAHIPKTQERL